MDYIIVICPHCNNYIQILKKDFNCKIFRHGVFKRTYRQIDPHLSKNECDRLVQLDLIIGCAKPFKLVIKNNQYTTENCGYDLTQA